MKKIITILLATALSLALAVVVRGQSREIDSFDEFVQTFSGMMNNDAQGRARGVVNDCIITQIQLDALQDLFNDGVRNADQWIYDTTIDLSLYGDLWIFTCFEANSEFTYTFYEGHKVRIDVNIELHDEHTRLIRQALLVPYTTDFYQEYITQQRLQSAQNTQDEDLFHAYNVGLSNAGIINLVQNHFLTQHPFSSVGIVTFRDIDRFGSAFVTSRNTATTAAHVIHGRPAPILTLGRLQNGNPSPGNPPIQAGGTWVHGQWIINNNPNYHHGIIVFPPLTFPANRVLPLRESLPDGNITSLGYAWNTTHLTLAHEAMFRGVGFITRTSIPGAANSFHFVPHSYGGMSGGPVLDSFNQAFGIITNSDSVTDTRAIRITPQFLNMLRSI